LSAASLAVKLSVAVKGSGSVIVIGPKVVSHYEPLLHTAVPALNPVNTLDVWKCLNLIGIRKGLHAVTFTVMVPSAPPLQLTAVCVVLNTVVGITNVILAADVALPHPIVNT
jgi:hypothetical protein